jgi:RimJ/RimL family protein N-acetyltransferase
LLGFSLRDLFISFDMRSLPILTTDRLTIRPFTLDDLATAWAIGDRCFGDGSRTSNPDDIEGYRPMLTWQSLAPRMLAQLAQPPYGDRAVVLTSTGAVIGQVGFVPCVDRYDVIPALAHGAVNSGRSQAEVGLFWAVDPAHQRQGYASEAARALIDYAFDPKGAWLGLHRLIATTAFDNDASQAVMRKLGMRLERNTTGQPPWLQVVGFITR